MDPHKGHEMIQRQKPFSNDSVRLKLNTVSDQPRLEFDLPSVQIGVAEYLEGPTGCTAFHFPNGANGAVDLHRGSPGVLEHPWGRYDAICFAGAAHCTG